MDRITSRFTATNKKLIEQKMKWNSREDSLSFLAQTEKWFHPEWMIAGERGKEGTFQY
jgi:hypothetical protein